MYIYFGAYAICAIISLFICRNGGKTRLFLVGSVAIVLILTLLAGLRSLTVGTDTSGYAIKLYKIARGSSTFASFLDIQWFREYRWTTVGESVEVGYLVLVWIARKFGSFQVLLFLTSFLTVCPFYYALARRRNDYYLPICLIMFMLIYFNWTLNAMRQWVAASWIFLSVFWLYDPSESLIHQKMSYTALFVAFLFHSSAVMGIAILIIRHFLKDERGFTRFFIIVCIVVVLVLFTSLISKSLVSKLLSAIGLSKFIGYLGSGSISFVFSGFILQLPFLVLALYLYKSKKVDSRLALFYLCIATLCLIFSQLASLGLHSGRISLYFDLFEIPLVGLIVSSEINKSFGTCGRSILLQPVSCFVICGFVFAYSLVYWLVTYGAGSGETLPYLFFWQ